MIDDHLATDDTVVTALVYGNLVGSAAVTDGRYIIIVTQRNSTSFSNKPVHFKVGDIVADQIGTWDDDVTVSLNLTAKSECKQP